MKLEKITIENYKSIEHIEFVIDKIDNGRTYSLIGINESGKSSFLKAISLFDSKEIDFKMDFFNEKKPVRIIFHYDVSDVLPDLFKVLQTECQFPKELIEKIDFCKVDIISEFKPDSTLTKSISENIHFKIVEFNEYYLKEKLVLKKEKGESQDENLNLEFFFKEFFHDYFWKESHNVVLWKPESKYLILDEIDLDIFATSPADTSIPLLNCFILSGINELDINSVIAGLTSAVAISSLQSRLSDLTTKHINKVWPEHLITILFLINNNKISLLIEDEGVNFQPKTASQRSDGFKQFISFLLTISAENYNKELENTILLIDEPETHLHPVAQLNLLKELIEITSNDKNNILFFATHSNYLIDKSNLDRNYKVSKDRNHKTRFTKIEKKFSTYSEVNFEVFNIETSDYHNELYGFIESQNPTILETLPKTKNWKNAKINKEKKVSLSEYIRHSIHHPENKLNKEYTVKELSQSIKELIDLKKQVAIVV